MGCKQNTSSENIDVQVISPSPHRSIKISIKDEEVQFFSSCFIVLGSIVNRIQRINFFYNLNEKQLRSFNKICLINNLQFFEDSQLTSNRKLFVCDQLKSLQVYEHKNQTIIKPLSLKAQQRRYEKDLKPIMEIEVDTFETTQEYFALIKRQHRIGNFVGNFNPDYKILTKGIIRGSQVLYDIEIVSPQNALYANELQLREIHFKSLRQVTDALYCLIQYEWIKQKRPNQKDITEASSMRFLRIFDFWCDNQAGKLTSVLYVVQEKLTPLFDYINQIVIKYKPSCQRWFGKLFKKLFWNNYIIFHNCDDLKYYSEAIFHNIYVQKATKNKKKFQLVYSFRYKSAFSVDDEEQFRELLNEKNNQNILFYELQAFFKFHKYDLSAFEEKPHKKFTYQSLINKKTRQYYVPQYKPQPTFMQSRQLKKRFSCKLSQVQDEKGNTHCLKQMPCEYFDEFATLFINTTQISQFSQAFSLINIETLLWDYEDGLDHPYTLSILMEKAQCSVLHMIKKKKKPFSYQKFFPIFRDSILGLVQLHANNIAHRHIKPSHILRLNKNSYVLTDFGLSINLNYQEQYSKNEYYQKGNWNIAGTLNYLDPILRQQFDLCKRNQPYDEQLLDLYKADIYSLGLTLFFIATGVQGVDINSLEENEKICYIQTHKQNLPLPIKQTILHMTAFKTENRIPTYSLFNCLQNIMRLMDNNLHPDIFSPKKIREHKQWIGYNVRQDLFSKDIRKGNFQFQKFKKQSQLDQTFYTGHLKLDYKGNSKEKLQELEEGTIVILKPNYIPCVFNSFHAQFFNKCSVNLLGKNVEVDIKDVLPAKLPMYKYDQRLEYYDSKANKWVYCELLHIYKTLQKYQIQYRDKKNRLQVESLPFETLRLRHFILEKTNNYISYNDIYQHSQVDHQDVPLMNYTSQLLNFHQLHHMDMNLSKAPLKDWLKSYNDFTHRNMLKPKVHVFVNDQEKSQEFISEKILDGMLIEQLIGIEKCDLDDFSNQHDFSTLKEFFSYNCSFKDDTALKDFWSQFKKQRTLQRLAISDLYFKEESILDSEKVFTNALMAQPLKQFELYISRVEFSKVKVNLSFVIRIFQAFSEKKLQSFHLELYEIENEKLSKKMQQKLEVSFKTFLKCQTNLNYYYLKLWLTKTPKLKLNSFNYYPKFIKDNKQMIEKLDRFYTCLWVKNKDGLEQLINNTNDELQKDSQFYSFSQDWSGIEGYFINEKSQ